jgi:hypothetical protein
MACSGTALAFINTVELRNLDRYLYKIKCKWENRIKEFQLDGEWNHRTN